ncbi:type VII secretion integral membrane protein EccD [Blastococcus sp. TF02A-26]|uniref:type VII secretion integral membrane protein EccD n=1 Tax=Blastococcus sp. TF02A-26 TaxID=2250577 RepID=UPI0013145CE8|nr:type VII secretion integral membrane protein EccD [Blastococcus sp. TF02A-26]
MTRAISGGLARITVAAPDRRVDVALPDAVPVAELLPTLLRHAGTGLADAGQEHGGWALRRVDGTVVDPGRSLAGQEVRDGEVLHLVPRQREWPELDYDDVVDAIARSARERSRTWGSAATRRAGVAVAAVALVLALLAALGAGTDRTTAGSVALGVAALALLTAGVLARALGDAGAAVVLGVVAIAGAAAGAAVVGLGDRGLISPGPWQVVAGSVTGACVSLLVLGLVSVHAQYAVAGATAGLLGAVAGLAAVTDAVDAVDAAALVLVLAVAAIPAAPLLAVRLGKVPMPVLPATTEELLTDRPQVSRARVAAQVRRSDELLTGMLAGAGLVAVVAAAVLVADRRWTALLLVGLAAVGTLLRARLFPAVRHRVSLLVPGLVGLGLLAAAGTSLSASTRLAVLVPALVLAALVSLAAGLRFADRRPSPYLGRVADVLEVLVVLALVPVACLLVGLYGYLRGLYG